MASETHSMIFATGEPAYAVDRRGTIVAWNAAARRVFGYSAYEAIGRKCWEVLQGQDAFGNTYCGRHCPLLEMAVHGKPVNRCKMSFRIASEEMRRFTVTTLVLFDTPDANLIHLCRSEPTTTHQALNVAQAPGARGGGDRGLLTLREREVLHYLSQGHTTKEIATQLSISTRTVRNHVEHILHKLHAHSRLEAVAISRRLGLH
jgi:DNA-binding CsgD family transcriptional regulator